MPPDLKLTTADITQDWAEALSGISDAGAKAFYDWLTRQEQPTNVVDFFAERDKRRGITPHDPDADDEQHSDEPRPAPHARKGG